MGTPANKGKKVPLQKHCARCGCRASHLGGNQAVQPPIPPINSQSPLQHSSSVVQGPEIRQGTQRPPSQMLPQHSLVLLQRLTVRQVSQKPLSQMPVQHSLSAVQEPPFDVHAGAHLPVVLSQLPLQHCLSFLHFFPVVPPSAMKRREVLSASA